MILITSVVLLITIVYPVSSLDSTVLTRDECFWGRLYLRGGISPIQYFKGSYGGAILEAETSFVFPDSNVEACEPFSPVEAQAITGRTLLTYRGTCPFDLKTKHAQEAGALALVIISTSESVTNPVGNLDDLFDLKIATVMIRQSAGGALAKTLASHPDITGRLIPYYCNRISGVSTCQATNELEVAYAAKSLARGGKLLSDDGRKVGEYLTARFGGLLPTTPHLLVAAEPAHGCAPLINDNNDVVGKIVLIHADHGECASVERVNAAQDAGAAGVVLILQSHELMATKVQEDWMGFNTTIGAASVSHTTGASLIEHVKQQEPLVFRTDNDVHEAWSTIHGMKDLVNWPSKMDARETWVRSLLQEHAHDEDRAMSIKTAFVQISGGTLDSFNMIVRDLDSRVARDEL